MYTHRHAFVSAEDATASVQSLAVRCAAERRRYPNPYKRVWRVEAGSLSRPVSSRCVKR